MNFTFPYNIAGTATNVVVAIEDEIVAEAQKLGIDLTKVEAEAKTAIDSFVKKVTSASFFHTVEEDVMNVVHEVENFVTGGPSPTGPTGPTPPAPTTGPTA